MLHLSFMNLSKPILKPMYFSSLKKNFETVSNFTHLKIFIYFWLYWVFVSARAFP